jgi:copper chaperone CopZ
LEKVVSQPAALTTEEDGETRDWTVAIQGISCASCVARLEKALLNVRPWNAQSRDRGRGNGDQQRQRRGQCTFTQKRWRSPSEITAGVKPRAATKGGVA